MVFWNNKLKLVIKYALFLNKYLAAKYKAPTDFVDGGLFGSGCLSRGVGYASAIP
jgi:hypothetical protein